MNPKYHKYDAYAVEKEMRFLCSKMKNTGLNYWLFFNFQVYSKIDSESSFLKRPQKVEKISHFLALLVADKTKRNIFSNFVALPSQL